MVVWNFLHDVKIFVFTARHGLIGTSGKPKPAFAAFRGLGGQRPGPIAVASGPSKDRVKQSPDRYAIATARLDGSDFRIVYSRPDKDMTHARVSPDGSRIVFTGYNKRGKEGLANEDSGYENTEVAILNLDGTGLETIIAPKPGVIASNGDWTPDGKSIFFISTDNPQRAPELRQIDLATRAITRLPTPDGLQASDPHRLGDRLIFPAKVGAKGADPLWIMNVDGTAARQVTRPPRSSSRDGLYGDFDPKLSPDGSKAAFMRIDGGLTWRVMVLDLKTGEEKRLSPPDGMEWLPTWSGDGKLLLFTRVDTKNVKETGLYTMTPEGAERRKVPLPAGLYYNHGTFFPGEKASPSARIIFSASRRSWLQ
jgi:Tol biopolymer transport system component